MAYTTLHLFNPIILLLISVLVSPAMVFCSIGINYGQVANNLPAPKNVIPLVKSIGATRLKLYDADSKVLCAFANTGVEFIVGLGNEYLTGITQDPNKALDWVKTNVQVYLPATKIVCIAVGNEVLTFNDTSLSDHLLPAMENIHTALVTLNLHKQVTVTTAHSLAILESSYHPSSGSFRGDLRDCLTQLLKFQEKICSPFLINAYPFFAYKANPKQISLDFVLFQPNSGILDPGTNLHYDNMLHAQIDAVYSALASLGSKDLPVHISETGWPSKGDDDEVGATLENAKKYNGNLIKLVSQKKGTPLRPNTDLNIYVFALFNENMKPGPTSERNYGLFKPDGTPAYSLGITTSANNTTSSGNGGGSSNGGGGGGNNGGGFGNFGDNPPGYLDISSSATVTDVKHALTLILVAVSSWMVVSMELENGSKFFCKS